MQVAAPAFILPEFANEAPKDYAKLMRQPGFICFRARKENASK
jgi:hypothetical protein